MSHVQCENGLYLKWKAMKILEETISHDNDEPRSRLQPLFEFMQDFDGFKKTHNIPPN